MKKYRFTVLLIILVWIITAAMCRKSLTKLTYIECGIKNGRFDSEAVLSETGESLTQDFRSPYQILHGFMIRVNTYDRNNNSFWNFELVDPESGSVLYKETRNASHFPDKKDFDIEFKENVRVQKDHVYQIRVTAENAKKSDSLAFSTLTGGQDDEMALTVNGEETKDRLYLSIYGGNSSRWWAAYTILLGLIASLVIVRFKVTVGKGVKWYDDTLLTGLILGAVVFLLLRPFTFAAGFTDEWDNVLGGTMISQGKVLYRDYVTQHTPVGYYLCSIYALLGARSLEQFRILYYLTDAVLWAAVYCRYSPRIGRARTAMLAILETVLVSSLYAPHTTMIVADRMQGMCLCVLLLEFILYCEDRNLGLVRSVIVSLCVWGSIGAAFISVYSVVWVALAVLAIEIYDRSRDKISPALLLKRYFSFVAAIAIPPACAALYFGANHALGEAYKQAYVFNRVIYPEYTSGMGSRPLDPIIMMFENTFKFIDTGIHQIITAQAARETLPQLIVIIAAMAALALAVRSKKYLEALTLFLVMCSGSIRSLDSFHGMTAWFIAILILMIYVDPEDLRRAGKPALAAVTAVAVFMCSYYVDLAGQHLRTEQACVSEKQQRVIDETNYGDYIMVDAYREEPLYFVYKGRKLANKTAYMLPWYMDWYEQDTIDELNKKKPKVVVFRENRTVWDEKGYARDFVEELKKNYSRISDDPDGGWRYTVWLRKEE